MRNLVGEIFYLSCHNIAVEAIVALYLLPRSIDERHEALFSPHVCA